MQKQLLSAQKQQGFSLLEILIVLVIIGVLVGLAVPAWSGFEQRGKSVASFNNLRQWAQALMLYAADYDGAIPYEGSRDSFSWNQLANVPRGDDRAWFNLLPPYVEKKPMKDLTTADERQFLTSASGVHRCPLVRFQSAARPSFSYMMNSQLYNGDGPTNSADTPLRLVQIPAPSRTVIFADADVGPEPTEATNDRARGRGRHVGDRQPGGRANLVMLDGSVTSFTAEYLRPDTFTDENGFQHLDNNRPDVIWNPWTGTPLAP